ncbi:MAG TPA: c-type cytochrome, methanol metabolism-related [Sneathiellales bacterium]|nr:c-type cytochrome, methanol metabolism-related [Sneathiellales bacterium]
MVKTLPIFLWLFLISLSPIASAEEGRLITEEDGKYLDTNDIPTYKITADGTVDWYTYNGFRRYHSECHVCHGPDGLGSSFAPALASSMKDYSYDDFMSIVVNGRERVTASEQQKMPAFGQNPNVMCYLDDIYVYLMARSDDAVGRGRPRKKVPKSDAAKEDENACFGD